MVTELHVGNVSRASSTVTVASQRGRVKGIEGGRSRDAREKQSRDAKKPRLRAK